MKPYYIHKGARNDRLAFSKIRHNNSVSQVPELALLQRRSKSLAASLSLSLTLSLEIVQKFELFNKLFKKLFLCARQDIVVLSEGVKPLTPYTNTLSQVLIPWITSTHTKTNTYTHQLTYPRALTRQTRSTHTTHTRSITYMHAPRASQNTSLQLTPESRYLSLHDTNTHTRHEPHLCFITLDKSPVHTRYAQGTHTHI